MIIFLILSAVLNVTAAFFIIYLNERNNKNLKSHQNTLDYWGNSLKEMYLRGTKIIILLKQTQKYSKICRRLYEENQNLKLEVQGAESLFQDIKTKVNELELKIQELESKKRRKNE